VSSPEELRSYAVDCARLATAATDPRDKARLLDMARVWSDLAARIEKLGHPDQAPDSLVEAPRRPPGSELPSRTE
jgi:hypothetical protein